MVDDGKMLVII